LYAKLHGVAQTTVRTEDTFQLQARKNNDGIWTDIFPAQVEWMCREGYQLRALEITPVSSTQCGEK